jgi:hypothetical protein
MSSPLHRETPTKYIHLDPVHRDELNPSIVTKHQERMLETLLKQNDSRALGLGDLLSFIVQNQIESLQSWPQKQGKECQMIRAVFCGHHNSLCNINYYIIILNTPYCY